MTTQLFMDLVLGVVAVVFAAVCIHKWDAREGDDEYDDRDEGSGVVDGTVECEADVDGK